MKLSIKEQQLAIYFGKALFETRDYKLKDMAITSRVFNYWKSNDVLTWFPEHKMANFNFIEAAWLLIIEELRKFGVSIEAMRNLTNQLVIEAFKGNLTKVAIQKQIPGVPDFFLRGEVSHFSEMIKWILTNKTSAQIVVDREYEAFIMEEEELLKPANLSRLLSSLHIIIPLKPIVMQLFRLQIEKGSYKLPSSIENEVLLLENLKSNKVDSLRMTTGTKVTKLDIAIKDNQDQLSALFLDGTLKNCDNLELKVKGSNKYVSINQ